MSVNSRIPPPFANRLSGASVNSACAGMSFPSPSLCGPQSSRYTNRVDPRRACGVAPALQSTPTKPPSLPLLCRRLSSLSSFFSVPLLLVLALSIACTLSLSLSFLHACPLSLSRFLSLPLARVLSSRSRSRSLSLSRRSTGSAHFAGRVLSHAGYPVPSFRPFSRPSLPVLSRPLRHVASTQCHRSAPSAGHRSASCRVRCATSRRLQAPRGIHPP